MLRASAITLCLLLLVTATSCNGTDVTVGGGVGTPVVVTSALPKASVGLPYNAALVAHNAPDGWNIEMVPAGGRGLTADLATGTISGVPESLGVIRVRAYAYNYSGSSVIHQYELVIGGPSDSWLPVSPVGAPITRTKFGSVWTGSRLLIWGGEGVPLNHAGRIFDPANNVWSEMSTIGAPTPRHSHFTIWTGTHMFIWGGQTGYQGPSNWGGLYHPESNSWFPTNRNDAPLPRGNAVAIWAGDRVIIWGGTEHVDNLPAPMAYPSDGLVYSPTSDQWSRTSTVGAPDGRSSHAVVWTGSRMIVFGGSGSQGWVTKAGSYDPLTDTWHPVAAPPGSDAWFHIVAVWTGERVIAWGSKPGIPNYRYGATYDPSTDTWTPMSTVDAPPIRGNPDGVWTGDRMIIWGGQSLAVEPSQQPPSIYNPATDTWVQGSVIGAPVGPMGRFGHATAWTGDRMIIWGGQTLQAHYNDGAVYFP